MPSAWIERRETSDGHSRYAVKYRFGGRESAPEMGKYIGALRVLNARSLLALIEQLR
jgi:hypothetical protein